jgi:anaerobic selenocysteine-containing dehydrogenase
VDGAFPTADGRANFAVPALPDLAKRPGEFELSTRRGKQFNSLVYADTDPLNGARRDAVLMNGSDAAGLNLKHGQRVTLVNAQGRLACSVFVAPIAPGNLQVHFPEGNVLLTRGLTDKGGGVPDYNAKVRVEA